MIVFFMILGALAAVGLPLWIHHSFFSKDVEKPAELPDVCCGKHDVCEKKALSVALTGEIVYYEDEELDRFKGRDSNGYTLEDEEEFREVLVTLRKEDVSGWGRSLQLRGIELPVGLRDEYIIIYNDAKGL